jgi:hypothetical protein
VYIPTFHLAQGATSYTEGNGIEAPRTPAAANGMKPDPFEREHSFRTDNSLGALWVLLFSGEFGRFVNLTCSKSN